MASDASNDPHLNPVAAYYDRLAPSYGEGSYARARRGTVLQEIAPHIERARSILDLGCGNGPYSAEFSAMSRGRLFGADLSPEMLSFARRRLGGRINLIRADATSIPFAASSFDVIFMSHVLMLVGEVARCLADIARCLAPGGVLIATVGVGGMREALSSLIAAEQWKSLTETFVPRPPRDRSDDARRYGEICEQVGLSYRSLNPSYTVTWAELEEWIRNRWFGLVDEQQRQTGEEMLAELRPQVAGRMLTFHEPLLLAEKPRA